MSYWPALSCALVGMGFVLITLPFFLRIRWLTSLVLRGEDLHHTHKAPVPRLGGLVLVTAFLAVELFIALVHPEARPKVSGRPVVILASLAVFALGFWDDIRPLGARKKLLVQVIIALAVCNFGIVIQSFQIPFTAKVIHLGAWGTVMTVLWLVGMTNLVNLIDGVDGLAGGICLMLMSLLAYVAHTSGTFECLMSGMAGALAGFLVYNFPPARIYLGDGGAYFLGFQVGLLSLVNSHKGTIVAALVAPLFVLALPILDTLLALLRRGLRGLPLFRPDRKHLHHHMLQMGLSRRRVVLSFYALTLVFLAMGFAAYWSRGGLIPILLGLATLILLLCAGKFRFSRNWFAVGRVVGHSLSMRQEVQYALTLMKWLELEGSRRASVEELWEDLVFAAKRLGYTSVALKLQDGERVWEAPAMPRATQSFVQMLHGGFFGRLELRAAGDLAESTPPPQGGMASSRASIADARLFEIISDLVAEGWIKAASSFCKGDCQPLKFNSQGPSPRDRQAFSQTTRTGILTEQLQPAEEEVASSARNLP